MVSQIIGLPIGNGMREIETFWNNSIGAVYDKLKIHKYQSVNIYNISGEVADAKKKYRKTYPNVTDEEATKYAKSRVKSKVTSKYKEMYLNAYENKKENTMALIEKKLASTNLYDDVSKTTSKWIEKFKEDKLKKGE